LPIIFYTVIDSSFSFNLFQYKCLILSCSNRLVFIRFLSPGSFSLILFYSRIFVYLNVL
jgi:hypothetical protein